MPTSRATLFRPTERCQAERREAGDVHERHGDLLTLAPGPPPPSLSLLMLTRKKRSGCKSWGVQSIHIILQLVRLKTDVIVTIGTFMTPAVPRRLPSPGS